MAASYHRRERTRVPVVVASALLAFASVSPAAADNVRWRTVVGIIQANNVAGGIGGGGQPWTTLGGHASVDLSANHVEFEVRGLVLAGGDSIGTPDGIAQVRGTLVCDPAGARLTIDTVLVPLSPTGDAEFSGAVPPIPSTCTPTNIAFLIRIPAGRWIANGAVRTAPATERDPALAPYSASAEAVARGGCGEGRVGQPPQHPLN